MKREISIAFQTNKSAGEYVALAKLVNQYDFDAVSVYCDLPYHPSYAPLLLMAPHIQQARIGPAAIAPSRMHPLDIAAQTALLAEIAPGGVYVGIARGAWLEDHGIHEQTPSVQAIRETVDIIRYMLSGQSGGYQGQIYHLAKHVHAPYPLPTRPIPMMIGTWGKNLGAAAGELADEVKVGGSANPNFIAVMRSYLSEGERLAKRPDKTVKIAIGAVSVIDDDRTAARIAARHAVAMYLPVVAALDPTLVIDPAWVEQLQTYVQRGEMDAAAAIIPDDLLDQFAFSGNADDIIKHANRLFEAGAQRIEFGTPHGLSPENGIRILGEKVIPALRHQWV